MLEKPNIQEQKIAEFVTNIYNLPVAQLVFLPLGNDTNSAVYQIISDNGSCYLLKLRKNDFNPTSVLVPKLLNDLGIEQIIAPLPTKSDELWDDFESFRVTLYPFIEGKSGFSVDLTDHQWETFGHALRAIHNAKLPKEITDNIPNEVFSPDMRERVKKYLKKITNQTFKDPTVAALASFIHSKKQQIQTLINNAERTGNQLKEKHLEFVLCHADIHANNILIDKTGKIFIIDWDTLILAPKERDLMFIGGGVGGFWNKTEQEKLFYKGYGKTEIDSKALAYYRCERIIVDIVEVCRRSLLNNTGEKDKKRSLEKFIQAFSPNNVVDIAIRTAS